MLSPEQATDLPGATVFDPADEELGTVDEVFLNTGDDQPQWAAVALEDRRVLVPLDGAELDGSELRVRYPRELVIAAPEALEDAIDPDAQSALYEHYGIADADLRDDSGFGTGRPPAREQGTARDPAGGAGADDAGQGHP